MPWFNSAMEAVLAYGYNFPMTEDEWAWFTVRAFPSAERATSLVLFSDSPSQEEVTRYWAGWGQEWEECTAPCGLPCVLCGKLINSFREPLTPAVIRPKEGFGWPAPGIYVGMPDWREFAHKSCVEGGLDIAEAVFGQGKSRLL